MTGGFQGVAFLTIFHNLDIWDKMWRYDKVCKFEYEQINDINVIVNRLDNCSHQGTKNRLFVHR